MQGRGKATAMRPGSAQQHPEFNFLSSPWENGLRCTTFRKEVRCQRNWVLNPGPPDRAVEQIGRRDDDRPYFGFISLVGPHPPLAPPIPFNRMYDPDRMPNPVRGEIEQDQLDEENPIHAIRHLGDAINLPFGEDRQSQYYGEISYLDSCLGRILDCVEASPNSENTLICSSPIMVTSSATTMAGKNRTFSKALVESHSCLVGRPNFPTDTNRQELVSLADLFGVATKAAGNCQLREGVDLLGVCAAISPASFSRWHG